MADQENIQQSPLSQIVSSGLQAATPGSVIGASLAFDPEAFSSSDEAVAKLEGGDELRLRQRDGAVFAEILSRGEVVQPEPSGQFTLADGKTMILERGRIVGGTSLQRESWAMFALLTDWPANDRA
ncbi:hypothetical protein KIPE111705_39105 [Kibdelosporangium persicum]|uniref:hypothetical protein n=1 Tax=Kibdelosporangium persicum TaxID=2698649 RepID=UPI0015661666|nr:hypothetical protein [Kibdelosporangium persicum]